MKTSDVERDQADRHILELDVFQAVGVMQRNEHRTVPARFQPVQRFLPGTHNTSAFPLSLTARAATNRKSETRLMYFSPSGLTCSPVLCRERHHHALGAPGDGAGKMQGGGGRRAARQHEGAQRLQARRSARRCRLRRARSARRRCAAARSRAACRRRASRDRRRGRRGRSGCGPASRRSPDEARAVWSRARPMQALASSTVPYGLQTQIGFRAAVRRCRGRWCRRRRCGCRSC